MLKNLTKIRQNLRIFLESIENFEENQKALFKVLPLFRKICFHCCISMSQINIKYKALAGIQVKVPPVNAHLLLGGGHVPRFLAPMHGTPLSSIMYLGLMDNNFLYCVLYWILDFPYSNLGYSRNSYKILKRVQYYLINKYKYSIQYRIRVLL